MSKFCGELVFESSFSQATWPNYYHIFVVDERVTVGPQIIYKYDMVGMLKNKDLAIDIAKNMPGKLVVLFRKNLSGKLTTVFSKDK